MNPKPYINTDVPRNPNRQHMTPEEAAGLIAIGALILVGVILGSVVTWVVMR